MKTTEAILLNQKWWATATFDDVEQVLKSGECTQVTTEYGWTPLMFAAGTVSDQRIITTLVDYGADVDARNMLGKTALMLAVEYTDYPIIVNTLLELDADPTVESNNGQNAMFYVNLNRNKPARREITSILAEYWPL